MLKPPTVQHNVVHRAGPGTFEREIPDPPSGTGIVAVEARHAYWKNICRFRFFGNSATSSQFTNDITFLLAALSQIKLAYAAMHRDEAAVAVSNDELNTERRLRLITIGAHRRLVKRYIKSRAAFDDLMAQFISGDLYAALAAYDSLAGEDEEGNGVGA